jgi:hypothetical protein
VFNHQKQVGFVCSRNCCVFVLIISTKTAEILLLWLSILRTLNLKCLQSISYFYCRFQYLVYLPITGIVFFILHLFVCIVPFLNIKSKYDFKFSFITRFFKDDYIFISGVRRNLVSLVIFFLLALALSPLKLFPLVALFLFNNVMFSFYEANESVQMLQASQKTPKQLMASSFKFGSEKNGAC